MSEREIPFIGNSIRARISRICAIDYEVVNMKLIKE
jgi:hypothetical protein